MVLPPMVPRGVAAGVAALTPAAECTASEEHRQRLFRPDDPPTPCRSRQPLREAPIPGGHAVAPAWEESVSRTSPLGGCPEGKKPGLEDGIPKVRLLVTPQH